MHGDASSSDVSPYAGAGANLKKGVRLGQSAACPTLLFGSDNMLMALCTKIMGLNPVVRLIDTKTNKLLASLDMPKGSLLGGVYAYMDNKNRLVMVDGNDNLVRITHERKTSKQFGQSDWTLKVTDRTSLRGKVVSKGDGVIGLVPDWKGNVFVATLSGTVGIINPATKEISSLKLGDGERIDNSISSAPEGVSIATSHATYLLKVDENTGKPVIIWKQKYDRGSARKPGQLSWGTGATPTFFGPTTGSDYLMITDNADKQISLLIYETKTGKEICKHPIFGATGGGTECSSIGYDKTVIVASTYGYPYPRYPDGAGLSTPLHAPFVGGIERIDITEEGCKTIWKNPTLKSAAVPRFSSVDGFIYTTERQGGTSAVDAGYSFYTAVINSATGKVVREQFMGYGFIYDTLEMVGTILPDGTWYQGLLSGIFKSA